MRHILVVLLVALSLVPGVAAAQFEDAPPEIQAIFQKARTGQKLTPDERQKMKDWALQRATNSGGRPAPPPPAAAKPASSPCYVTVITDATVTDSGSDGTNTRVLHYQTGAACQVTVTNASPGNFASPVLLPGATTIYTFTADPDPSRPLARASLHGELTVTGRNGTRTCTEAATWSYPSAKAPLNLTLSNFDAGDRLYPIGGLGAANDGLRSHSKRCDRALNSDVTSKWMGSPFPLEDQKLQAVATLKEKPQPVINLSIRALDGATSGSGPAVVAATEDFDFVPKQSPHERVRGHGTVILQLRTAPLTIEPVDEKAYDAWIPAPPNDAKYAENGVVGTPLQFKVSFDGKSGASAGPMQVSLEDLSVNAGVCTNAPVDGAVKGGLRFADTQPPGVHRIDDTLVDTDGKSVHDLVVTVEARDTGAFGRLHALSPAIGAEAWKSIPLDDNHNDIADAWEKRKDVSVFDQKLRPSWDEEAEPPGPNTGDGLTLYEEYRGLVLDSRDGKTQKFTRIPPGKKKVFFLVDAKSLTNDEGIDLIGAVLKGLDKHQEVAGDRVFVFRTPDLLRSGQRGKFKTWRVNPNSDAVDPLREDATVDPEHFGKAHHAVPIVSEPFVRDPNDLDNFHRASTFSHGVQDMPTSADDCAGIFIHPHESVLGAQSFIAFFKDTNKRTTQAWLKDRGLTAEQMEKRLNDPAVLRDVVWKEMAFTVMHESGHALGRFHHESATSTPNCTDKPALCFERPYDPPDTCPMHYYYGLPQEEFLGGFWDPSEKALLIDVPASFSPGWTKTGKQVPYQYCSHDDGAHQGGTLGVPRYHD